MSSTDTTEEGALDNTGASSRPRRCTAPKVTLRLNEGDAQDLAHGRVSLFTRWEAETALAGFRSTKGKT